MSESVSINSNVGNTSTEGNNSVEQDIEDLNKNLRSDVWKNFKKKRDLDQKIYAYCNHCNKRLIGCSTMGTTHLKTHLKKCYKFKRVNQNSLVKMDENQRTLIGDKKSDGTTSLGNYIFNQEMSRNDMTRMMIFHEYPFAMASHKLFKKFVKGLRPEFKLLGRCTKRNDCFNMFKAEKEKLYLFLRKLTSRVSLTTDLWTSELTTQGYFCLTCHYIDDEWKMRKKIINFVKLEAPHTGELIAKAIREKLFEWNIDGKLFSIVLDNASSNDVVVRELLKEFSQKNSIPLHGRLFHMRCCAHVLNLVVQDGLSVIRGVLQNVRDSVKYIKSSQARFERFKMVASQVNAPKRSLFLDVSTRWNSTYLMLENAIHFQDAFDRLKICDECYTCAPTGEDWNNARIILECLKLFYEVTIRISGTKYPTLSIYFSDMCGIYLSIRSWLQNDNAFVYEMAKKMFVKFEKYWHNTNKLFAIAEILDPRYKMLSVSHFYKLIYENSYEADRNIQEIRETLFLLFKEYEHKENARSNFQANSSQNIQAIGASTTTVSSSLRGKWGLKNILKQASTQQQKSELDLYLEEAVYPEDESENENRFDILGWWKFNGRKYPIIASIARDILGIPSSTVSSESAFSTGGRVLNEYRSRLKPDVLEGLICTQDWLRESAEEFTFGDDDDYYNGLSTLSSAAEIDEEIDNRVNLEIGDN